MPQTVESSKKNAHPANYQPLAGSKRGPSPTAKLLGPADPKETFKVTISLRRRPDGPPVPNFDYFVKTPPKARPRLSDKEFAAKYGAAPAEIAQVVAFAEGHGLTVVETHAGRRTVVVSGTVAQMNKAFAVTLGRYEHEVSPGAGQRPQKETYRGRDGFIHVPKELEGIVVGVFGLDNRRITKRAVPGDPPSTNPVPLPQVTQLYSFPPNLAAGQTIGIFSEQGYQLSDLHQFNTTLPPGYSVPDPTDVTVRGPGNLGFDPSGETTQDVTIAATVAPGAAMAVYFTTYDQVGWVDLLLRVIHPNVGDPICSVLSSSFYVSNGDDAAELASEGVTTSWIDAISAALQDAALQGVTFCTVSGDYGVDTSSYGGAPSDGKQHVVYPGSDPWALCCGGTTIGDIVDATFDEYVWNDTAFGQQWATGGGVSDFFNVLPSYQVNAGVPVSIKDGHIGRGVPDVSANASVNSGYPIILNGAPSIGDGTSAAAPLWAGLIAVINSALGLNVGYLNPVLYALGTPFFRDIVGAPGPATNGINGVPGYPAHPGWDACTGWGSPNGVKLLAGLRRFYGRVIAVNESHALEFGTICRGPAFRKLEVFNVGTQDLFVTSVKRIAGSADFTVLPFPAPPLAIAPGDHVDFTIEFKPTVHNVPQSAIIQIVSDDPVTPKLDLTTNGLWGTGSLATIMVDHGNFGAVCLGSFADLNLTLNNNGPCSLTIFDVTSSSAYFQTPSVTKYPLVIAAGVSLSLPIRFVPGKLGPAFGTITVTTENPSGSHTIPVSGDAPGGKLVVTGPTCFGGVQACCRAERTLAICNTGDCKLNVLSVAFARKSRHWKLINNPFPATLHPGSCLSLVIRYKATEKCSRSCDLVITSDDPSEPVKHVELLAYTIWSDCGCKKCCDDCGKGMCQKPHCEPCCCDQCHDDCEDEEDGGD